MSEKRIKSYDDYKKNRKNGRKVMSENTFTKKIKHIIEDTTKENELRGYSMKIMFECIAIQQHIPFLEQHLEDGESNIYRTINNIVKAKARSIAEILYLNSEDIVNLKINTHGKKDDRLWDLIVTMEERELKLQCVVKYSKVKELLKDKVIEKVEEVDSIDITYIGESYLNKQQYFTKTLKDSLNALDIYTQELVRINNKL